MQTLSIDRKLYLAIARELLHVIMLWLEVIDFAKTCNAQSNDGCLNAHVLPVSVSTYEYKHKKEEFLAFLNKQLNQTISLQISRILKCTQ